MGKTFRKDSKKLKDLRNLTEFSRKFAKDNAYLHGMANGMIMNESIITGKEPDFVTVVGRYKDEKFKRGNPHARP